MLERVQAGDDAAGAVAEQENRQARLARFHERDECGHVRDVVGESLDVESLAVGVSPSSQIEGVGSKPGGGELRRLPTRSIRCAN